SARATSVVRGTGSIRCGRGGETTTRAWLSWRDRPRTSASSLFTDTTEGYRRGSRAAEPPARPCAHPRTQRFVSPGRRPPHSRSFDLSCRDTDGKRRFLRIGEGAAHI